MGRLHTILGVIIMTEREIQIIKTLYEDYVSLAQKATSNPCEKCKWNSEDVAETERCKFEDKAQKHCTMARKSGFEYIHAKDVESLIEEMSNTPLERSI